jgi:hypothetical protein
MQINSSANSSQIALPKVNKLTDRVFNKLDPSNTGSFNKASFEKMITQGSGGNSASTAIADKIFSKLDVSGNGEIDKSEFDSLMDKIKQNGGLQPHFSGDAASVLRSLMAGRASSSDSSGNSESSNSESSSNNPIDLLMAAIDSNNQASSTIQSTQDYLSNFQKNIS